MIPLSDGNIESIALGPVGLIEVIVLADTRQTIDLLFFYGILLF